MVTSSEPGAGHFDKSDLSHLSIVKPKIADDRTAIPIPSEIKPNGLDLSKTRLGKTINAKPKTAQHANICHRGIGPPIFNAM
jgi:hypothetical protein